MFGFERRLNANTGQPLKWFEIFDDGIDDFKEGEPTTVKELTAEYNQGSDTNTNTG